MQPARSHPQGREVVESDGSPGRMGMQSDGRPGILNVGPSLSLRSEKGLQE